MTGEPQREGDGLDMREVLERFRDSWQEDLHTALPGIIQSYDAATQRADIVPGLNRILPTREGEPVSELMPTLRSVPVVFPGSGDWFVRWPISAGDEVLLVICERDPARWLQTGERADPIDVRAHHLAHAVAIPGLRSRPGKLPPPDGESPALILGHRTGSTLRIEDDGTVRLTGAADPSPVALSPTLDAVIAAIAGAASGDAIPAAVAAIWTPAGETCASTRVRST